MNTKKPTAKPLERRPDDLTGQRQGTSPTRPDSPDQSEAPEGRKDFGKPERPTPEKPASKPGAVGRDQDGRSDWDAGRPVQLDDDSEDRRESESARR